MEFYTFLSFEFDSVAGKNSFNFFFHLLQALDKFFWSIFCNLGAGHLSIIDELESDEQEKNECKIQQLRRKKKQF